MTPPEPTAPDLLEVVRHALDFWESRHIGPRNDNCASCQAIAQARTALEMAESSLAALAQERDALREDIQSRQDAYESVLMEACTADDPGGTDKLIHCACVPHLREAVAALREDAERWREARQAFALFGHPIITPESADRHIDAKIAARSSRETTPTGDKT